MKRPAKIVVATTLGATLLLGGSTYAIWNSSIEAGTKAEILTGESAVKPLDSGLWTDLATSRKAPEAPPVIITDVSTFRAVPSDEIGYAQLFNVKFAGPAEARNRLQLTFNSDAGLNPAALKARGIIAQATVKDLDSGATASSDLTTNTLNTGYNFTGSLPAEGARVEVSLNFKINAEVSAEDTKNFKSLVSSSVLSVTAISQEVLPDAPILSDVTLPAGVQGEAYKTTTLKASGKANQFAVSEGALPEGMTLDAVTGAIAGTPKLAGTYSFTVTAKNAGGSSSKALTLEVKADPPTITTEKLPNSTKGVYYSQALAGTGESATYSVTEGELPPTLTINPTTGRISGTPNGHGVSSFTVTKTTVKGSVSKAFSIDVRYAAPVIDNSTVPIARKGVAYSFALTGAGEAATYKITNGVLPDGVSLDPTTGAFTGTPTEIGDFPLTLTKTNESGSVTRTLTILSKLVVPRITAPSDLPEGNKATPYEYKVPATGEDLTFTATSLPDGLTIDSRTGVISGTPTTVGSVFIYVTAANSGGSHRAQLWLPIRITAPTITAATLPDGEVALDYSAKIEMTDVGSTRITGAFPPGLTLNSATGVLSGKPTKSGTYEFTVEVSNNGGAARQSFSVYIETDGPVISTKTLPDSTQNVTYGFNLAGKGENSTYAITAGELPPGFAIGATTGRIFSNGNANAAAYGVYNFTVTKTNEKGSAVQDLSLNVLYQAPTLTNSAALGNIRIGTPFSIPLTGIGNGSTYSVTAGELPPGVAIDSAGNRLTGTGTMTGDYAFTLTKTNTTGSVSKAFTLRTIEIAPTMTSKVFTPATVNQYYEFQVVAKGENLTYRSESALPVGLTLDSKTGLISGTPTVARQTLTTIIASNTGGSVELYDYISVNHVAPTITSTELPNAQVGQDYSAKIETTGEAITFSGTTPSGLNLNTATGVISGKPTSPSTGTYTIYARNSGGSVNKTFKLDVITQPPTITSETLPDVTYNTSYNQTVAGAGTSNTYTVTNGALPKGLLISNNGIIYGTTTEHGVFNFTLTKTNVSGTVSKDLSLTVKYVLPTISATTLTTARLGTAYSDRVLGNGDMVTFSISQGELPAGLTLNPTTGTITGSATAVGDSTFTVLKQNADGMASREFSMRVVHVAPTFSSTAPGKVFEGVPYEYNPGGIGEDVTYEMYSGSLPEGLTFNSTTGVISGTSTAVGTSTTAYIRKTNSGGTSAKAFAFNVTYVPPTFVTTEFPKAIVGSPYSFTIETTGKNVVLARAAGSGSIPSGLTFNAATGVISGTPTSPVSVNLTITATNSGGVVSLVKPFLVANTPPTITLASLPDATRGSGYNTFVTSGTGRDSGYAIAKGSLPAGIKLDGINGQLVGTVSNTAVTSTFTLQRINNGGYAEKEFTITVK